MERWEQEQRKLKAAFDANTRRHFVCPPTVKGEKYCTVMYEGGLCVNGFGETEQKSYDRANVLMNELKSTRNHIASVGQPDTKVSA